MHISLPCSVANVQNASTRAADSRIAPAPSEQNAVALSLHAQSQARIRRKSAQKRRRLMPEIGERERERSDDHENDQRRNPRYAWLIGWDHRRQERWIACANPFRIR